MNHCIHVVCCLCGHSWCLRGCSYQASISDQALGDIIPRPDNIKIAAIRCPACSDQSYIVIL